MGYPLGVFDRRYYSPAKCKDGGCLADCRADVRSYGRYAIREVRPSPSDAARRVGHVRTHRRSHRDQGANDTDALDGSLAVRGVCSSTRPWSEREDGAWCDSLPHI